MKARYTTEAQILKKIDAARKRRDQQQVLSVRLHRRAVRLWKWVAKHEKASEATASKFRSRGKWYEDRSKTAARSVARYNDRILPRLGEKLSVFRTALIPFAEKEMRQYDHSVIQ